MVFESREGRQVSHRHIPLQEVSFSIEALPCQQEVMLTIRRLLQPPRLKQQG